MTQKKETQFVARIRDNGSTAKIITLPNELNLERGKVYQFSIIKEVDINENGN